jgi:hypothetical protein
MMHKRANSFFSKILLKFGARAIMLGSTAYYATDEAFRDYRVRKHEEVHYKQRKRDGLWTFYVKYIWYQIHYGYELNPYEKEARLESGVR